jgi:hypothetical protein
MSHLFTLQLAVDLSDPVWWGVILATISLAMTIALAIWGRINRCKDNKTTETRFRAIDGRIRTISEQQQEIINQGEQHHVETQDESRVKTVADRYLDLKNRSISSELNGLMKAGIATLDSDQQILRCIERCTASGKSPLGSYHETITMFPLRFFKDHEITERSVHDSRVIEKVIARLTQEQSSNIE